MSLWHLMETSDQQDLLLRMEQCLPARIKRALRLRSKLTLAQARLRRARAQLRAKNREETLWERRADLALELSEWDLHDRATEVVEDVGHEQSDLDDECRDLSDSVSSLRSRLESELQFIEDATDEADDLGVTASHLRVPPQPPDALARAIEQLDEEALRTAAHREIDEDLRGSPPADLGERRLLDAAFARLEARRRAS